jgi:hypothetical protein
LRVNVCVFIRLTDSIEIYQKEEKISHSRITSQWHLSMHQQ